MTKAKKLQVFEFDDVNLLVDKIKELIGENIEDIEKSSLAYKTTKVANKYILEVILSDD